MGMANTVSSLPVPVSVPTAHPSFEGVRLQAWSTSPDLAFAIVLPANFRSSTKCSGDFAIPAQGRNRGETGYAPTCPFPVLGLFWVVVKRYGSRWLEPFGT